MKRYYMVESLNMGMVTRVDHFPAPGEPIRRLSFTIFPGGKGTN